MPPNWSNRVRELLLEQGDKAQMVAWRVLRDRPSAEDAVQEALVHMLGRPQEGMDETRLVAYFLGMVRNMARMQLRTVSRRRRREMTHGPELLESFPTAREKDAGNDELVARIRDSIDDLPERERETVCLCCEAGCTQQDASRILGVKRSTVSYRLNAGLARLRRMLVRQGLTVGSVVALGERIRAIGPAPAPALKARLEAIVQHYRETGTIPDWALTKKGAGKAASVSARAGKSAWSGTLFPVLAATTVIALAAVGVGYGVYQAPETGGPNKKEKKAAPEKEGNAEHDPVRSIRIVREVQVSIPILSMPSDSMAFDGKSLWVSHAPGPTWTVVDPQTGRSRIRKLHAPSRGLAWDGTRLWTLLRDASPTGHAKKQGRWRLHALNPGTLESMRSHDLPHERIPHEKSSSVKYAICAREDAVMFQFGGNERWYEMDKAKWRWRSSVRRFPRGAVWQKGTCWSAKRSLSPRHRGFDILTHDGAGRSRLHARLLTKNLLAPTPPLLAPAGRGRVWLLAACIKPQACRLYLVEMRGVKTGAHTHDVPAPGP
jgi:RNA polymerase sigma factor (sigma-70 family)